ncbi:unnamed protein product [Mytilus coruscus]|uniref:Endonuclease/exonuclease/phosphatase domain-containing protein n=1 Tax=Mytilus coruscus TaxID=42192 RepID=A0A6J8CDN5_MYTCO|nr:unnamed protein product [Mytilus coruscus]
MRMLIPAENTNHQHTTNSNCNQIRIMVVNCRSLISSKKKEELQNMIETHKPDIILGIESHLDNTVTSSEVFPDQFHQNLPNVILEGDFNLPHINWQTTTVNPNPQYGKALNEKLIEISNNNNMNQMVNEPTSGQNRKHPRQLWKQNEQQGKKTP